MDEYQNEYNQHLDGLRLSSQKASQRNKSVRRLRKELRERELIEMLDSTPERQGSKLRPGNT